MIIRIIMMKTFNSKINLNQLTDVLYNQANVESVARNFKEV